MHLLIYKAGNKIVHTSSELSKIFYKLHKNKLSELETKEKNTKNSVQLCFNAININRDDYAREPTYYTILHSTVCFVAYRA